MKNKIKLGYELKTGKEIFINPSHLIVTGITQQSGKTTTLEALILRSGINAVVFKTKVGEKSFSQGAVIPPFFRDRSDYEFVRSLIEAYNKEKLVIEKGTLMSLCKGAKSLLEIKNRVDEAVAPGKLRGIKEEIYTRLQHYLIELIPQIQFANLSTTLNIGAGINIMNLERFTEEAQSLIIQAVADEVLKNRSDTIIVIPEAWKFLPQKYNNPCKRVVESFIRQGATNNNFIWLDSQDMAGVDKIPLKQISTWILGYQAERNEVKHTLDQISLPKAQKPKEDDIMNLPIGHFFLSSRDTGVKVYVQPSWLNDDEAIAIAKGETDVTEALAKKPLQSFSFTTQQNKPAAGDTNGFASKKDLSQLRIDFFNKIEQLVTDVNNYLQNLGNGKKEDIDIDELAGLVMQKMPLQKKDLAPAAVDVDNIIAQIMKKIPAGGGAAVYQVAPLEVIKKNFLQEIKNKITGDITTLSPDEKKALKYIEVRDSDVTPNEMITQCFLLKPGGSSSTKISNILKSLVSIDVTEKTAGGRYRKGLQKRITTLMNNHSATDAEKENTYNHILNDLL